MCRSFPLKTEDQGTHPRPLLYCQRLGSLHWMPNLSFKVNYTCHAGKWNNYYEFYRYILSNLKGNHKSEGKLCPENTYKKKEKPECVCVYLCVSAYFLKVTFGKWQHQNFCRNTQMKIKIFVWKEGSLRHLGAGLCWKRMAPNHVGNMGTAMHSDSLCCN